MGPGFHSLGVNCGGGVQEGGKTRKRGSSELLAIQTGKTLLRACKHSSASEAEEVEQVGGDDEGGEGVLGVGPVPPLLLLLNIAREEQARHTAGYQTTPVWFLWQLSHGLLSSLFAQKGRRKRRQP